MDYARFRSLQYDAAITSYPRPGRPSVVGLHISLGFRVTHKRMWEFPKVMWTFSGSLEQGSQVWGIYIILRFPILGNCHYIGS